MALAILGMPLGKLSPEIVREILRGGAVVCASAGIPVAGGHSIDVPEPIYGLAVIGICAPQNVRRNAGAKPGDVLILTKPIGVGIYSSAIKSNALPTGGYSEMIATTTQLNRIGAELARNESVHAITDVTGFGLLGHGLEMARGAQLRLVIHADDVPLLSHAAVLAQQGFVTGASHRNWSGYRERRRDASGDARVAAPPSRRSADVGRTSSRRCARRRRIGAQNNSRLRLSIHPHHWIYGSGRSSNQGYSLTAFCNPNDVRKWLRRTNCIVVGLEAFHNVSILRIRILLAKIKIVAG